MLLKAPKTGLNEIKKQWWANILSCSNLDILFGREEIRTHGRPCTRGLVYLNYSLSSKNTLSPRPSTNKPTHNLHCRYYDEVPDFTSNYSRNR